MSTATQRMRLIATLSTLLLGIVVLTPAILYSRFIMELSRDSSIDFFLSGQQSVLIHVLPKYIQNPKLGCPESMFYSEDSIPKQLESQSISFRLADYSLISLSSTCLMEAADKFIYRNPHYRQLEVVQQTVLNASAMVPPGTKLILILSHDFGRCMSERAHLKHYSPLREKLMKEIKEVTVLSPNGELDTECYIKDHDVVIPPYVPYLPWVPIAKSVSATYRSRTYLLHFRGTVEWTWNGKLDPSYSRGIRQTIFKQLSGVPNVLMSRNYLPDSIAYANELRDSDFCICPLGYATWSPRLVQAILTGCIPIIIADNTDHPFESLIDYTKFAIIIPEIDVSTILQVVQRVSPSELYKMRKNMVAVWKLFIYHRTQPDSKSAIDMILKELNNRLTM